MPQHAELLSHYSKALVQSALNRGYDLATVEHALSQQPSLDQALSRLPDIRLQPPPSQAQLRELSFDRVDPKYFTRTYLNLKLLMQDEFFGLTRHRCKPGTFIIMADLVLSSKSLRDALRKGFRYYSMVTDDIRFRLSESSDEAIVETSLSDPELDPENFLPEWWPLLWIRFSSWLTGEVVPVRRVEFTHEPAAPLPAYQQVFSAEVVFSAAGNTVFFDRRHLDRPVVKSEHDLRALIESFDNQIDLARIPGADGSLRDKVRAQIARHFAQSHQFLSMEQVAEEHCMSSQTLRRRLEREHSSYRAIKEEIRREVVMKWLGDSDVPISEIARRCGFAEPNGLSRAVKAWTGCSPTEYRALHRGSGDGATGG